MKTSKITIDNLADYPIDLKSAAGKVVLFENSQAGTQDWKYAANNNGVPDTYLDLPAGVKKELTPPRPFTDGQRVGFARTAAGSFVLCIEEHGG